MILYSVTIHSVTNGMTLFTGYAIIDNFVQMKMNYLSFVISTQNTLPNVTMHKKLCRIKDIRL